MRIMLHPLGMFALLCGGVFITCWTLQATAETVISSVIEAPPLTSGAVITSPQSGSRVSSSTIHISGTCPADSYIKLYINDNFKGVALCGSLHTFDMETSLYGGRNELQAKIFNQTDLPGPTTPGVEVTYQEPAASSSGADGSSPTAYSTNPVTAQPVTAQPPLLLASDFHFQTFTNQQTFSWSGNLEGGVPPYNLHIDWGDGQSSDLYFAVDPPFTMQHHYKRMGYYAIKLYATDHNGKTQVMQLAALITNKAGQAGFLQQPPQTGGTKPAAANAHAAFITRWRRAAPAWLLLAWPAYLIILLMTASFWLGERRELQQLRRRSHA